MGPVSTILPPVYAIWRRNGKEFGGSAVIVDRTGAVGVSRKTAVDVARVRGSRLCLLCHPPVADASTFRQFPKRRNDTPLISSVPRCFFFDQEADLPFLRLQRGHELTDRGK